MASEIVQALTPVVQVLEDLGVAYQVGGSVATSAYGIGRATLDVDIVCDLAIAHVAPLVRALEETYYVDADMILDSVNRRSSCNLIHLATMLKIDVFIVKDRAFERHAMTRGVVDRIDDEEQSREFVLASAEDMILHKLDWYRKGNEVSERQWLDVLGVLKVQSDVLDYGYLAEWAEALSLVDLLRRALIDAGIRGVIDSNEP